MGSHFNTEIIDIYMKRKAWKRDECILWILWWAPFDILGKTIRNLIIEKILYRNKTSDVKLESSRIRDILELHMDWHGCRGIDCEIMGLNERDPIRKSMKDLNVTHFDTHVTNNILCKFYAKKECRNESTCVYSHHPSMLWYDMKANVDPWFCCMIEPLFDKNVHMEFTKENEFSRPQQSYIHDDFILNPSLLYSNLFVRSRMFREKYGISLKIPRNANSHDNVIKLQYENDKLLLDFIDYISYTFGLKISINKEKKSENDLNSNRNENMNSHSYEDNYNRNEDNYDRHEDVDVDEKTNGYFFDNNEDKHMDNLLDEIMVFSWNTIGTESVDPIKKKCDELNISKSENNSKTLCKSMKKMKCSRGSKCKYSHHPSKLWKLEKDNYHRLWETENFILWLLCHAPRNDMGLKFREKIIKNILSRSDDFVGSKNIINLLYEHVKWKYIVEIKMLENDNMEKMNIDVSYNKSFISDKQISSSSEHEHISFYDKYQLLEEQPSSNCKSLSDSETSEIIYGPTINYEKKEDEYQKEINRIMKSWMDERISYMCDGMNNEIDFFESLIGFFDRVIEIIDDKILR